MSPLVGHGLGISSARTVDVAVGVEARDEAGQHAGVGGDGVAGHLQPSRVGGGRGSVHTYE